MLHEIDDVRDLVFAEMFGQEVSNVELVFDLVDRDLILCNLVLHPELIHSDVSHFAKAFSGHNGSTGCCICVDSDAEVNAHVLE